MVMRFCWTFSDAKFLRQNQPPFLQFRQFKQNNITFSLPKSKDPKMTRNILSSEIEFHSAGTTKRPIRTFGKIYLDEMKSRKTFTATAPRGNPPAFVANRQFPLNSVQPAPSLDFSLLATRTQKMHCLEETPPSERGWLSRRRIKNKCEPHTSTIGDKSFLPLNTRNFCTKATKLELLIFPRLITRIPKIQSLHSGVKYNQPRHSAILPTHLPHCSPMMRHQSSTAF